MKYLYLPIITLVLFMSCGNLDDFPALAKQEVTEEPQEKEDDPTPGEEETDKGDALEDDIKIDETPLAAAKETETVIPVETEGFKDFIENFKYDDEAQEWDGTTNWREGVKTLEVTFADNKVSYVYKNKKGAVKTITPEDFSISPKDGGITILAHTKCHYILKGETANGFFKIYSDKKFILELNNVSITNPNGAAINIQKGVEGGKRCFLVVNDGTRNFLTDGTAYTNTPDTEQEKGAIFAEGKICISGGGYLCVNAKGKSAIACDDYVYIHKGPQLTLNAAADHDGIKTNDGVFIAGGVLNISCYGKAAKGINTENDIKISGGRTTIINTSEKMAEDNGYSSPYCIKTDTNLSMTGGQLLLSASRNEDGNGIKAQQSVSISGGNVKMIVKGTDIIAASESIAPGTVLINGKEKN